MSDADTIEEIKERRREQLLEQLGTDNGADDDSAAGAPDTPIHIESVDHFSEVTESHDVVLVDFYADWCGPCQQLEPIVEQVAAETDAAVAKVDIDRLQPLAQQYGVRGVPTMVLFSDGEAVEQTVGVKPKAQLTTLVENYT
ncbi:thioredoxin [Halohasta salina]|uniref:thioredoxin n=1 Tax=Halohasta salina TaxID=2961621 RepID=UPI0020A4AC1E|nr:thioredoxin [Halohasta salina]